MIFFNKFKIFLSSRNLYRRQHMQITHRISKVTWYERMFIRQVNSSDVYMYFTSNIDWNFEQNPLLFKLARENSRHFTSSPRNNVGETSAEILYWWQVTTLISMENSAVVFYTHVILQGNMPLVASRNVGCFLRQYLNWLQIYRDWNFD